MVVSLYVPDSRQYGVGLVSVSSMSLLMQYNLYLSM